MFLALRTVLSRGKAVELYSAGMNNQFEINKDREKNAHLTLPSLARLSCFGLFMREH
jgi:hypothetical protein